MRCSILFGLTFFLATISPAQETKSRKWFVPDYLAAQYAGSIGFASAGAGYSIFHNKANVDLLIGVVPRFTGSEPLETATIKFTGSIIRVPLNDKVTLTPLTAGVYFTYTFGKEFSHDLPGWYPDGYYWWSEAVRVNVFIGGNVTATSNRSRGPRKVSAYYEIGTNEIKLVSLIQNHDTLNFWKILHAGVGVRYFFRDSRNPETAN
jgi:hypothetical protein